MIESFFPLSRYFFSFSNAINLTKFDMRVVQCWSWVGSTLGEGALA